MKVQPSVLLLLICTSACFTACVGESKSTKDQATSRSTQSDLVIELTEAPAPGATLPEGSTRLVGQVTGAQLDENEPLTLTVHEPASGLSEEILITPDSQYSGTDIDLQSGLFTIDLEEGLRLGEGALTLTLQAKSATGDTEVTDVSVISEGPFERAYRSEMHATRTQYGEALITLARSYQDFLQEILTANEFDPDELPWLEYDIALIGYYVDYLTDRYVSYPNGYDWDGALIRLRHQIESLDQAYPASDQEEMDFREGHLLAGLDRLDEGLQADLLLEANQLLLKVPADGIESLRPNFLLRLQDTYANVFSRAAISDPSGPDIRWLGILYVNNGTPGFGDINIANWGLYESEVEPNTGSFESTAVVKISTTCVDREAPVGLDSFESAVEWDSRDHLPLAPPELENFELTGDYTGLHALDPLYVLLISNYVE